MHSLSGTRATDGADGICFTTLLSLVMLVPGVLDREPFTCGQKQGMEDEELTLSCMGLRGDTWFN